MWGYGSDSFFGLVLVWYFFWFFLLGCLSVEMAVIAKDPWMLEDLCYLSGVPQWLWFFIMDWFLTSCLSNQKSPLKMLVLICNNLLDLFYYRVIGQLSPWMEIYLLYIQRTTLLMPIYQLFLQYIIFSGQSLGPYSLVFHKKSLFSSICPNMY